MQSSRRSFLRGFASVAGVASAQTAYAQHVHSAAQPQQDPARSTQAAAPVAPDQFGAGIVPVISPDVPNMPWRLEGGIKVFDIRVEHVRTELIPGRVMDGWGFNGRIPGPTIQVTEGDRVRLNVENRLPEPFSMHWHGLEIPNEMDGMPGISQEVIAPNGRFVYEFTLKQNGTFFYHSHMAMQEMMGLIGLFIIHARRAHTPRVDRDFGLILQEWALLPNNTIPNSLAMEFNWLTINGKAGPATTPMLVKVGERIRIRIVNLGMDHHPMHLHGHTFYVTGTEAGRIRTTALEPGNTVLVGVAQARDIEFVADNPGDWHFHCHLPHHMMNQMASMVGPLMMSHANAPRPGTVEAGMGLQLQLNRSRNDRFALRAQLAALTGVRDVADRPLAGTIDAAIPNLEREQIIRTVVEQSPELRAARADLERARAVTARARREPFPDLFLRGGSAYNREHGEDTGRPIGWEGTLEAGVSVPLFNRNAGGIAAAGADEARAQAEVTRLELSLQSRAALLFADYLTALRAAESCRTEILPRAEEAYRLYLSRYREMAAAYPQVLVAQRTFFEMSTAYLESLNEAWRAALQLQGFLAGNGLDAPAGASESMEIRTVGRGGER